MKRHIKSVVSLTAICAVVALLLGLTNFITAPVIEKQENDAVQKALTIVLPNGEDFKSVDLDEFKLPNTITEAYSEKNGGYVFKMVTTGYASGLTILCGIDSQGVVKGATCVASNETNGAEKSYGDKLKNKTVTDVDTVDTVAGSTKTTLAYRNAVKDALNAFAILNGETVDLRSEEEILQDNLKSALSLAEGKFTSVFVSEDIEDISDVYSADNKSGFVFILGEEFIATDNVGNVITETSQENKQKVSASAQKIINSALSEIDLTKYPNMPTNIEKAYKTNSGNYVFELKATGYGILGSYHTSGEFIKIKISATDYGKIISCVTLSQGESENYGAACEHKTFYSQFNGKDETNYSEIDAISGATITTNGYKNAVGIVFQAVKILKGAVTE